MGNPVTITFYRCPINNYKVDWYTRERLFSVKTTLENSRKKSYVISYINARLIIKNLGWHIGFTHYVGDNTVKKMKDDQDEITYKRMITKITNAIKKFEADESTRLLPNWENPKYLRTKEKLKEYQERLDAIIKSKQNENNPN